MRIAVFSTKSYDRQYLEAANQPLGHELTFFESKLNRDTVPLAQGFPCVCVFVNDQVDAHVLLQLQQSGTELIALRSAGFNHVDLKVAQQLKITVVRVPAYSPHAVAEHTMALLMAMTRIFHGFGCELLGYDIGPNPVCEELGMRYTTLDELFRTADIVTIHCPLTPDTYHLINSESIAKMKRGVTILNTSRGAIIDAPAVLTALKSGQVGNLGLDVYEEEGDLFFEDLSNKIIQDDVFARLLTLPNVVITGHQGFFTANALANIAQTTLQNVTDYETNGRSPNEVSAAAIAQK